MLDVRVSHGGLSIATKALIDTGAPRTVFPRGVGDLVAVEFPRYPSDADKRIQLMGQSWARGHGRGRPTPGPLRVYRFTIDLAATSVVLPAGHRLRLHVSSSCFPEREPNPNTCRPIGVDTDADLRAAHQQVFHDALHPSQVVLPIIPG